MQHWFVIFLQAMSFLGLATAFHANGAVTVIAHFRLGEDDAGGFPGFVATNSEAYQAPRRLTGIGGPVYLSEVSADAQARGGSSLGIQFNGATQCLTLNAVLSSATAGFGIEAWVRPAATPAVGQIIAYNGDTSGNGWGFFQRNNSFIGLFVGMTEIGAGPAVPGAWTHVALVRESASATLYVDGVPSGTTTMPPITPAGGFAVASHPQSPAGEFFNGAVDEVRVFSFLGAFNTNDLLFHRQVATLPADSGPESVTFRGSVSPGGLPSGVWFEWGTSASYGNVTAAIDPGPGADYRGFSQVLSGLARSTSYHCRAVLTNALGTQRGLDVSFRTAEFVNVPIPNLPLMSFSSAAWADFDGDGRLDFAIGGIRNNNTTNNVVQLWRNTGSGFSNVTSIAAPGLPGVAGGSLAWGDYDNDGRLDLFLNGQDNGSRLVAQIWRNTGGGFVDATPQVAPGLTPLANGGGVWGDYDNDGRLDLLLTGLGFGFNVTEIWRNTPGGFINVTSQAAPGVPALRQAVGAWGDYDNDGRLDFIISGSDGTNPVTQIWHNLGGTFVNVTSLVAPTLFGVVFPSVAWGDFDGDGRLDFVLMGGNPAIGGVAQLWRNTGAGFTEVSSSFAPGLPAVTLGSVAWGDYDNDGRLDLLIVGHSGDAPIAQLWRNTGNSLTNVTADVIPNLTGVQAGKVAWGDFDGDGRLDFLITGTDPNGNLLTQLWRNQTAQTNHPPTAPTGLHASVSNRFVNFRWSVASDPETPAAALTYNVRIGTTPGGSGILSASASASGLRRLADSGNAQQAQILPLVGLVLGATYYWSVQSVDGALAGSPFAAEQAFTIEGQLAPPGSMAVPGDTNGDGVVDQNELDAVLAYYWPNSPWLRMTNVAGLGWTNVSFALSNSLAGAFTVEYTTNLINWSPLGPATPRYLFTDTNAPALPQRYYRLRWP